MIEVDLDQSEIRELNDRLHRLPPDTNERAWHIVNPKGRHAIAVGLDQPITVTIDGHVGFYCAGMNKQAEVIVNGHAGPGVAENMMSGFVRVRGNASQSAGASARGGLLVVEGDTSSRCGISMKGADIVVGGSVGHMSAFMAQRGNLVVCGDSGRSLGIRSTRRGCSCAALLRALAPTASRRSCGPSTWRSSLSCSTKPVFAPTRAISSAMVRRASSTISTSITRPPTDARPLRYS